MMRLLLSVLVVSLVGLVIPSAFAENVPDWVKNTAGWWADGQIDDSSFLQGIQYLIKEGIMVIPPTETSESTGSQEVLGWIKNNAGWWADGQIDDSSFLLGIQWLISNGIIVVEEKPQVAEVKPVAEVEPVAKGGPIIYDDDYIIEKFVSGLNFPTTMTFVGEDILVLEKNTGKVIRIQDNGVPYTEPVLDVPVEAANESGLLGITSTSNHVFLYFSESESGFDTFKMHAQPIKNKVYRYDWDGEKLTNPLLIKELPGNLGGQHRHHGGAMTTSQNNEIYFVIGDISQYGIYQNIISSNNFIESGSIFKVDTQNNNVELFAMGIRNSFGLAVDPVTGYLWDTENGKDDFDEINLVKSRFNSGWRLAMGPAVDSPIISQPFENFVYSDPEFSYVKNVGLTAIEFPDIDSFRKYSDWLFVGDFNNGAIYKFHLNADRTGFVFSNPELSDLVLDSYDEIDEILFVRGIQGGVTDIEFHNDAMYVVSIFGGSIYKIYLKESQKKIEETESEMLKLLKTRTGIEFIDLSNSDLSGANFVNVRISNVNFTRTNLSNADLSGQDLTGTILIGANLTGANLTGVDLSGMDLTEVILAGVDLSGMDLTGTILRGANLSGANLTGVDLSGMDLTGVILAGIGTREASPSYIDPSGMDLTDTIHTGANLTGANLTGVDLSGMDLTGIILRGVDLSGRDLTYTILRWADLTDANLTGVDLSGRDLTGTILRGVDLTDKDLTGTILSWADLTNTDLTGTNLSDTILFRTNLSGMDLRPITLTNADFRFAVLSGSILPDSILVNNDFEYTIFNGVDLSGKDLSYSKFQYADFDNANLEGTNLQGAVFVDVDLTKIKNKSLAGTDLSEASFAHSDLSGVDLSGVIMHKTNFWKADLSGVDFTVTDVITDGLSFIEANLSNSNFEGVDLSPKEQYFQVFQNKAHLKNLPHDLLVKNLISSEHQILIISTEVRGNDLAVNYVFFNSFARADLENANFKNAKLWNANFYSADLTNADLSGANLSNAFLGNADLSNANLEGTNLQDAILDNAILTGANLKCINHPICNSD